ncbi:MAG: hypothetical protein ACRDH5_18415, partial [bacterium]
TKALKLLETLPDIPERAEQELMVKVALGQSLMLIQGLAAPEVEKAFSRARELSQQVGETSQLFPPLAGLFASYMMRGDLKTALSLGEQLLDFAERDGDPALLLEAHHALQAVFFHIGDFVSSRAHFEQANALRQPLQDPSRSSFHFGHDPAVMMLCYTPWTLGLLGYADEALKRSDETLRLARQSARPYHQTVALSFGGWLRQHRREPRVVRERAEEELAIAREQGFAQVLASATVSCGWALSELDQLEEGMEQMRQGIAALRATGAELGQSYFVALLAGAYAKAGRTEDGLSAIAEALASVDRTGERFYEAELYRLKGELTLQQRKVQRPKSERREARAVVD